VGDPQCIQSYISTDNLSEYYYLKKTVMINNMTNHKITN